MRKSTQTALGATRRWGPGHTPPHPPTAPEQTRFVGTQRWSRETFGEGFGHMCKILCFSVRPGLGNGAGVVGASGVLLEGLFVRDRRPERGIRVAWLPVARPEGGCLSLGIFVSLDPWGASGGGSCAVSSLPGPTDATCVFTTCSPQTVGRLCLGKSWTPGPGAA